jgi:hypothetical protein
VGRDWTGSSGWVARGNRDADVGRSSIIKDGHFCDCARGNSGHILEKSHRAPPQGVARALFAARIRDSYAAQPTGAEDMCGGLLVDLHPIPVAQFQMAGQHLPCC